MSLWMPVFEITGGGIYIYKIRVSESMTPTAINNIKASSPKDNSWYTLAGVKVSEPVGRGVYIRNGKKYIK